MEYFKEFVRFEGFVSIHCIQRHEVRTAAVRGAEVAVWTKWWWDVL